MIDYNIRSKKRLIVLDNQPFFIESEKFTDRLHAS